MLKIMITNPTKIQPVILAVMNNLTSCILMNMILPMTQNIVNNKVVVRRINEIFLKGVTKIENLTNRAAGKALVRKTREIIARIKEKKKLLKFMRIFHVCLNS